MSSPNTPPPAVEGAGPFAFEITETGAAADCRRWRLKVENERLEVQTWNDASTWHDTIVIERRGPMMRVKLPVQADLRVLYEKFPAIEHVAPIVVAKRRLIEAGSPDDMPPQLIHTKVAERCWPIFGLPDPCPAAGAADFFGVRAVWAPQLDLFVKDPDAE